MKVACAAEAEADLRAVELCQKPSVARTQEDIKCVDVGCRLWTVGSLSSRPASFWAALSSSNPPPAPCAGPLQPLFSLTRPAPPAPLKVHLCLHERAVVLLQPVAGAAAVGAVPPADGAHPGAQGGGAQPRQAAGSTLLCGAGQGGACGCAADTWPTCNTLVKCMMTLGRAVPIMKSSIITSAAARASSLQLDVRLPVPSPGGGREERTLAVLSRGHTVGEAVLLSAAAQHTSVVVSSSSAMLLSLSRPDFSRAFKEVLDIRQVRRRDRTGEGTLQHRGHVEGQGLGKSCGLRRIRSDTLIPVACLSLLARCPFLLSPGATTCCRLSG